MGSSGIGARLGLPLLLFVLGGAATLAASRALYANVVLAMLLAAWTWTAIAIRTHRDRRPLPAPPLLPDLLADQVREQRRLTAYLNLSPAPLVTLDGERRMRAVNRAARRLFGCEEMLAAPPADLTAAIEAAVPGRSASVRLEIDGRDHAFALATADLHSGAIGARIAALVDIDAELRAAEVGALRDLLQVLSHEIMNALTPIASLGRTAADMLAEDPGATEAARDAIETIARRAEGLQRFTTAYRELARLPPPAVRRVTLNALIDDLQRMFAVRWPGIALVVDTSRAPRSSDVDPDQLSAALWALLQNAAEALDGVDAPRITVVAEQLVGGVGISVADNGPGVPGDQRDMAFQPFFTTKPTGSGVGLALVRQIMHGHQGTVRLIDRDRGAAFMLEWPSRRA